MKVFILSIAVMLLAVTFAQAQRGEQITVKHGSQAVTKSGRITVKFMELVEDSRCPEDVNCAWAGVARIKVQLSKSGKSSVVELDTNQTTATTFQGYTITLKALEPRQSTMSKYSQSAYSATFAISKK